MQATKEPNLSDILLSVSDVKKQVTILTKSLDLISPIKSSYEHSSLGTRAFERAMDNLDIDSDEVQELPRRNPSRSTIKGSCCFWSNDQARSN